LLGKILPDACDRSGHSLAFLLYIDPKKISIDIINQYLISGFGCVRQNKINVNRGRCNDTKRKYAVFSFNDDNIGKILHSCLFTASNSCTRSKDKPRKNIIFVRCVMLCAVFLRLIVHFAIELILYNDETLMPAAGNEVDAIVSLHLKY